MKQRMIQHKLSTLLSAGMINAHAAAPASLSNDSVLSLARRVLVACVRPRVGRMFIAMACLCRCLTPCGSYVYSNRMFM